MKNGDSWPLANRHSGSKLMSSFDHWMLGDPTSNRVADYRAAAQRLGYAQPRCIDWLEAIDHPHSTWDLVPPGVPLRIDSFGQRDEVIAALVRHGGGQRAPARGEVCSLDLQYRGMCRVLEAIDGWRRLHETNWLLQCPQEIGVMFDKWASHQRLLPDRPETILLPTEVDGIDRLIARLADRFGGRFFLKPRFASSASGVCCCRVSRTKEQLIAPIEIQSADGCLRLFNSLKVRSFTQHDQIRKILRKLIPQGMVAEAAVNKVRIDGERCDLRFVVIDGRADHLVVRQSASPITNLHLGNSRVSADVLIQAVGAERVQACRQLALLAASRFPGTLYCGVDILLPRRGDPLICEVNAFGDFLPNLRASGQSVYEAVLNAGYLRWQAASGSDRAAESIA